MTFSAYCAYASYELLTKRRFFSLTNRLRQQVHFAVKSASAYVSARGLNGPAVLVRYTCTPKMKFLGEGFEKLWPKQDKRTDRQTLPNALPRRIRRCMVNICRWNTETSLAVRLKGVNRWPDVDIVAGWPDPL